MWAKRLFYGYDDALQVAWRATKSGPHRNKEISLPLTIGEHADDTDLVQARWSDGSTWQITCLSVGDLKARRARKGGRQAAPLWSGVRAGSGHQLTLQQRSDRVLLVSLYEQSAQVLQIRVDAWGPLPEPQPSTVDKDDATLKACVNFTIPLCEKYASGEIATASDLKLAKAQAMEQLFGPSKRRSFKRPASPLECESKKAATNDAVNNNNDITETETSCKAAVSPAGVSSKVAPVLIVTMCLNML